MANTWKEAAITAIVLLMGLVPIYTFIMATYAGSLGALTLVTIALVAIAEVSWIRAHRRQYLAETRNRPESPSQVNGA